MGRRANLAAPLLVLATCLAAAAACTGPGTAFLDSPYEASDDVEEIQPILDCEFMTVWIDYSRRGNPEIAARIAAAMTDEFEALGTDVTSSPAKAYWTLEILATDNSRKDGYIYSALIEPQAQSEGFTPAPTLYGSRADRDGSSDSTTRPLSQSYNGLAYGPYDQIEAQAALYVRNAYAAIYPTAKELCEFAAEERQRENELDRQVPGPPEPL